MNTCGDFLCHAEPLKKHKTKNKKQKKTKRRQRCAWLSYRRQLTCMLVSCVVDVWLGCIGVVLNTVRESATPDSQEYKQADAGSRRLFSKPFSVRRVFV